MRELTTEEMAIVMFNASHKNYSPYEKMRVFPTWKLATSATKRRYRKMAKAVQDIQGQFGILS